MGRTSLLPLFKLGQTVATPGALDALAASGESAGTYLQRHVTGDWGEFIKGDDVQANRHAIRSTDPQRVFSAYRLASGVKMYVITEWDRSVTTLLLPSEY